MPNHPSAEQIIKAYELQPHPEGGLYKRSYQSEGQIQQQALPSRFGGTRFFSTAIYYLLPQGARSRLHRIASDEIWHFYLGGPLVVAEILPDGTVKKTILGQDIKLGQQVQYVVKAGSWFGAYPTEEAEYCFVGCTVSPGFDFADFEMADQSQLMTKFPNARELIQQLTD